MVWVKKTNIKGGKGSDGGPGPAGPANSLTIGRVLTVVDTGSASAMITGEAPHQVLELAIPRGIPAPGTAPTDDSLAGFIATKGTKTAGAVSESIGVEVSTAGTAGRVAVDDRISESTKHLGITDNKSFIVERVASTSLMPPYVVTRIANVLESKLSVRHVNALDNMSAIVPVRETLSSIYKRTQAPLIVNASGWWDSNRRMGLAIHEGVLIQDWEPPSQDWGRESMVFYQDGSARIEDASTPGAVLVARGAWTAVTHGWAAIRDGVDQGIESRPKYQTIAGRQGIGVAYDGTLMLLSFPGISGVTGTTIQQFMSIARKHNFRDLYMLDGGGSTQVMAGGSYVVASTDVVGERPVVDALCFVAAPSTSQVATDWVSLDLGKDATYTAVPINNLESNDLKIRQTGADEEVVIRLGVQGGAEREDRGQSP